VSRSLTPEVYLEKAERALSAARIFLSADNDDATWALGQAEAFVAAIKVQFSMG